MIEIRNVTKTYGDVVALDGASMAVDEGATVGLVGTNGAGKTTLFRLLVGHATPDEGTVRVAGREPTEGPALRERVGFVPEDAAFDPRLTGREVLELHARLRGVPADERDERVARVLETVGLAEAADRRVEGYSNGMTQRLAVGTALVRRPAVLLLDEPTAALDPRGVEALHRVVDRIRERTSTTIVVSSHVLDEVDRLCERVVVLDDGTVQARGSISDLASAAGDTVEVRVQPVDGDARRAAHDAVRDAIADASWDGTVESRGCTLVVECHRDVAFDVLEAARDAAALDGFEVEEPRLADAFAAAVDDSGGSEAPAVAATNGGDGA
jgi:Cu-processing system ATP-binding protein